MVRARSQLYYEKYQFEFSGAEVAHQTSFEAPGLEIHVLIIMDIGKGWKLWPADTYEKHNMERNVAPVLSLDVSVVDLDIQISCQVYIRISIYINISTRKSFFQ